MDAITQIKGKLLAELIAAIAPAGGGADKSTGKAGPPPLPAALTSLPAGEKLTARVLPPDADGQPRIAVAGRPIRAETLGLPPPPEARTPDATLTLQVAEAGDTPRLRLISAQPPAKLETKTPANLETQAREAIRQLTAAATLRQGSPAPLYADLATLSAWPDQPLPALRPIVEALLATRLDAARPLTPDALKAAVALAIGLPVSREDAPGTEAPRFDARALLTLLRDTARAIAPPTPVRDDQPPPPARDAAPVAARPAMATLPPDAPAETIAAELGRRAEQALERQGLHQLASLPEPRGAQPAEAARVQTLSFELPVALGQQTAIAGFRIERDPARRNAQEQPIDTWGIRFAIDADGIGPVHAHLRLAGAGKATPDLNVTLWAEAAATHAAFVTGLPMLKAALAESALAVGEIAILPGRPAEPPRAARGRLVDRAS
jgi:hypothetical protein